VLTCSIRSAYQKKNLQKNTEGVVEKENIATFAAASVRGREKLSKYSSVG
jgi:hypothetical protein